MTFHQNNIQNLSAFKFRLSHLFAKFAGIPCVCKAMETICWQKLKRNHIFMKVNHEDMIYESPRAEAMMLESEGVLAASDGNFEI